MKENKYDDIQFFNQYKQMARSVGGLQAAGEWHELQKMLPNFQNKRILDLGCGFGWHCRYAVEQGAKSVIGIDLSEKMLKEARKKTTSPLIEYVHMPIEDIDYPKDSFDVIISSLVFHYIESFEDICKRVSSCIVSGGDFIFSVEHPIFTAQGNQQWYYDANGKPLHWPVDYYFEEGVRKAVFLSEEVMKYHKTLTTYINTLIQYDFEIVKLLEPKPADYLMNEPGMKDELRRPMMLLIAARKK
ncbi:class I SAM-dependent methyltransferase [Alkaliphilus sp. MSJ-5]|uniref:Class I SAM-dependent methyltransferase n=1 Tax=Alkaliphilus flagellatus TaxID=2841507 RepID=A0ABS6G0H0_9FIRM|nr:class I SAM-dependent methyltransferase [Alkaliphilus flagellatus]MBU5674851.1 class I SAM-dependent methyltransferase [Alkaliphilus flagellatus]